MSTFSDRRCGLNVGRRFLTGVLVALCGTAGFLQAQPVAMGSHGSAGTVKVRVPAEFAKAAAGVMVADYGSFAVIEVPAGAVPSGEGVEVLADENRVLLNSGVLDTTLPEVKALQQPRGAFVDKAMQLVQFAGPIKPEWTAALAGTGVQVVTYIPSNAYLVYGDADQIARVQALAGAMREIQWNGAYEARHRIDPAAAALARDPQRAGAKDELFSIQLVRDPEMNKRTLGLVDIFRAGEVVSEYEILNYHNIIAPIPPSQLAMIGGQGDVVSIQRYVLPTKNDERQDQIIAGNLSGSGPSGPGYLAWLATKGFTQAQFTASNFAVDVTDSGVDNGTTSPNHFGLREGGLIAGASRIIYNRLVGTPHSGSTIKGCDGHGTVNTHIVGGYSDMAGSPHVDASGYHYGLGVCPFVKAGSSVIFDPNTFTSPNYANLQSMAYNDGARISTNSWGASVFGAYNTDSQSYDSLVRDAQPTGSTFAVVGNQQMVICFSAGNSGSGTGSIGSPGTGKNIISVGAAENVQAFGGSDGCAIADSGANSADDIISFSSRGPCTDGRKKPDIMAPGTHVSGGVAQAAPVATGTGAADACYVGTGVCGGVGSTYFPSAGQQFYTASSGTSHSCPAVAGGCALIRQFFLNLGLPAPSPAMTKAMLMNSARYMTGVSANDTLFSNHQGMGEMHLGELFLRGAVVPTILRDEAAADLFTATGQTRAFSGTIADTSKPFRVTLAWTDAPGATSGAAYKNNLDLTVTLGANTYKGNVFLGATSTTGGAADAANNSECVFLPAGTSGAFTVTVTATNINSDGVPANASSLDQDFALVVYNASTGPFVGLNGTGANTIADNVGNGNSNTRIDPGETAIQVTVPVSNTGNINATGVSATLVSNTPTVTVTTATSAYPDLAASGGTGSNATPYVLNVSASHVCGDPISLTLNITSNEGPGTYAFSLPTGLGGGSGSPVTFSYTGPAVAIPDNNATGGSANLAVSGLTGTISDVNFRFDGSSCNATAGSTTVGLDHTYVGDLAITLQSPSGTIVTLINHAGGSGNNFCGTLLDDSGASSIQSISAAGNPWTGTYSPNASLSAFNGQTANGTWILKAVDNASIDTGNIRAFSILVTTTLPPTCDPPLSGCTGASVSGNPSNQTVCAGSPAAFSVTASGTAPITYQWRKNAANIGGATGSTYTIASAVIGDAGSYDCVVTNACGSATSTAASLTVNSAASVSGNPSNQTVCAGSPAVFSVTAAGTAPITYQWRKNAANIGGATGSTYTIASAVVGDAGSYDCVVTNACGSATSTAASLTVNSGPSITTQPANATVATGSSGSFSVAASGTAPITYQWRKDAANLTDAGPISGSATASLSINPVAAGDAGSYDCVITNPCGTTTSAAAALTVGPCPSDLDDGSGTGTPDGGTDINDLLYFLAAYEAGAADLDDGSGTGTPDGGVDINDLLYFLARYEAGC